MPDWPMPNWPITFNPLTIQHKYKPMFQNGMVAPVVICGSGARFRLCENIVN